MALGSDVYVGRGLLLLSVSFILYYICWTIGLPLLEKNLAIHLYFPNNSYALGVPLTALIVIVTILAIYAHYLITFDC